jgi:hypothetical protein
VEECKKNREMMAPNPCRTTICNHFRKVEQAASPPFDFEFPLAGKLAIEA